MENMSSINNKSKKRRVCTSSSDEDEALVDSKTASKKMKLNDGSALTTVKDNGDRKNTNTLSVQVNSAQKLK